MVRPLQRAVHRPEHAAAAGDSFRVGSYNIQDFTDGIRDDYRRTRAVTARHAAAAAAIINELGADVLLLQEVENATILKALNERLSEPYPEVYITDFGKGGRATKRNIALLSRQKVLKASELNMAVVPGKVTLPRGALAFVIDLGRDHLLLGYAVHLKSNFGKDEGKDAENIAKRAGVLREIRRHAERVVSANPGKTWEILIAGDMNVDPDLADFKHDDSLAPVDDWADLWAGRPLDERVTIPTRRGDPELEYPAACFDRIVVSPALTESPWKVGRVSVLSRGVDTENVFSRVGENEIHASDHYPVYVDITR
jgi:endonuclease/exonuclease/phosphatase family metal-dependent hydrolase